MHLVKFTGSFDCLKMEDCWKGAVGSSEATKECAQGAVCEAKQAQEVGTGAFARSLGVIELVRSGMLSSPD